MNDYKLKRIDDPRNLREDSYVMKRGESQLEIVVNITNIDHFKKEITFRVNNMYAASETCSFDDVWFKRISFCRKIEIVTENKQHLTGKADCLSKNHAVVKSVAGGNVFFYCRDCKEEVR